MLLVSNGTASVQVQHSDLISTPSQTQSQVSNQAFKALIDLLTSDGTDETPSRLVENRPQANLSLRGPSGKLDFDKIRMTFASQNESQCGHMPPVEDSDSDDDDHHSHLSLRSVLPSRTHSSKQPIQRPSAGHRRSSTFRNQPWAPQSTRTQQTRCAKFLSFLE